MNRRVPWRPLAAELLGTFVLVFLGATSVVAAGRAEVPALLVAPFGFGLGLLAALYAFGEVSGGHFNPAVSLAMALDRRLDPLTLVAYWLAQLAGGACAGLVLLLATDRSSVGSTATTPSSSGTAFVIELVLTAIFVAVILQASRSTTFGSSALAAIPLTLVAVHFAAIPFTGCSVNPARTFGPALVSGTWDGFWIYVTAPLLGAGLAALSHALVVRAGEPLPAPATAEVLEG